MKTGPLEPPGRPAVENDLAVDLQWLVDTCATLRVVEQDGQRTVRVTVDLDSEHVVVAKQPVSEFTPADAAVRQAIEQARRQVEDHRRRAALRLVGQAKP